MNAIYLMGAIIGEVIGTSALKASDGLSRLGPSLIVIAGYTVAFVGLSLAIRTIPVGVAYAVWAGVGVVLIALISYLVFGQKLDLGAVVGIALITAGVIVVNLFSHSVRH